MTPDQLSTMIAHQTGASGGLWTHTPVDWNGNESTPLRPTRPVTWPTDAAVAVPPDGSRDPGGALPKA